MSTAQPKPTHDSEHQDDSCPRCGADGGGCGGASSQQPGAAERSAAREQSSASNQALSDEDRIAQLEKSLSDAQEQRLRLIAEYQTAQRRALESETRARATGIAQAIREVIPVIDNLELALGQTRGMSTEKAIQGLVMLRTELSKAIEKTGIEKIEPKPGDEFDPHQHEAVMRQPANGVDPDCISVVFHPGYRLGETVLRAAKVAIAP